MNTDPNLSNPDRRCVPTTEQAYNAYYQLAMQARLEHDAHRLSRPHLFYLWLLAQTISVAPTTVMCSHDYFGVIGVIIPRARST